MYLFHNKIDTRSKPVPALSELFKKARTQAALEKTASTQVEAKGVSNFGDKKAPPFGAKKKDDVKETDDVKKDVKKDEVEDKEACGCKAAKVAEKEDEGETSGQPQAEAKLVNKPKLPEGEEKAKGGKTKSDKDEAPTSGQPQAEAKLVNKPEVQDNKEARITGADGKVKVARFVRISELSNKQKSFLRSVYEIYWPKAFVDALLEPQ